MAGAGGLVPAARHPRRRTRSGVQRGEAWRSCSLGKRRSLRPPRRKAFFPALHPAPDCSIRAAVRRPVAFPASGTQCRGVLVAGWSHVCRRLPGSSHLPFSRPCPLSLFLTVVLLCEANCLPVTAPRTPPVSSLRIRTEDVKERISTNATLARPPTCSFSASKKGYCSFGLGLQGARAPSKYS